ncbi:hypothetical protein BOTBODRAFT_35527 [Botryobasidium botryosum FD-172 SS1]|uniref:Transposase IS30-like HTH domain-containing protein n=1 Tax=Botryobasidium botryosum (strain FD-172 SS1) TaxID=930990 RepID=A0A067MH39_BOTB1|nr:hypothetical protein BOTBODRAFT_35527 [Botryobasidium botryosum FD-172 SS1]
MRPISKQKQAEVIALLERGLSTRAISQQAGVGLATVSKVRQGLAHPERVPPPKYGRPKAVSDRQTRRIVRMIESGDYHTATEIQRSGVFEGERVPSGSTIRRLLREAGLTHKRAAADSAHGASSRRGGHALSPTPTAPARRRSTRTLASRGRKKPSK